MKNIFAQLVIISLIFGGFAVAPAIAQQALTANIVSPVAGANLTVGQPFNFVGSASGGNAVFYSYVWNFGDGSFGAGDTFSKTYTEAGSKTVTLTVADHDGAQASVSRTINVNAVTTPTAPTVNLLVNGGNGPLTVATGTSATLSWTSTNATSCAASGSWSGSKPVNSSESTGTLNTVGALTYTLTCTGAGGSSFDSVTLNVTAGTTGVAPVISNIHVDGITQTSAVVHWTTNIPADSRVIYDTVSHPTIDLTHVPNYDYAHSTVTSNTEPKVTEHSVTLTGLTPNTQYFFRVLSQA
ncbi:MAG: PKD domain-containing protein [Patescibacteria group bacterium]